MAEQIAFCAINFFFCLFLFLLPSPRYLVINLYTQTKDDFSHFPPYFRINFFRHLFAYIGIEFDELSILMSRMLLTNQKYTNKTKSKNSYSINQKDISKYIIFGSETNRRRNYLTIAYNRH